MNRQWALAFVQTCRYHFLSLTFSYLTLSLFLCMCIYTFSFWYNRFYLEVFIWCFVVNYILLKSHCWIARIVRLSDSTIVFFCFFYALDGKCGWLLLDVYSFVYMTYIYLRGEFEVENLPKSNWRRPLFSLKCAMSAYVFDHRFLYFVISWVNTRIDKRNTLNGET